MNVYILLFSLFLTGCAAPWALQIMGDKGCHIDGLIAESADNDGCVSPSVKYCTIPGMIFDPNDDDNCVAPPEPCPELPDLDEDDCVW